MADIPCPCGSATGGERWIQVCDGCGVTITRCAAHTRASYAEDLAALHADRCGSRVRLFGPNVRVTVGPMYSGPIRIGLLWRNDP